MIQFLKNILGIAPKTDYKALLQNGAQIIDVRTKDEFKYGHINGSVNIPLQSLQNNFSKIKKSKPIITCCASGSRSALAKSILKSNGFTEVYNGGSWASLQIKIE